jgi:hypothetical protein
MANRIGRLLASLVRRLRERRQAHRDARARARFWASVREGQLEADSQLRR